MAIRQAVSEESEKTTAKLDPITELKSDHNWVRDILLDISEHHNWTSFCRQVTHISIFIPNKR